MSVPTVALGEVATFLNGGTPSKAHTEYFDGDIPWITGADITASIVDRARSHITEQAVRSSATNVVPAGTVLLVTRTSVGKVARAAVPLAFSQDITAIIHDPSKVDAQFLVHFLKTQQVVFERVSRGATIKGVTRDAVEGVKLPLPSLAEQRRIAAMLDKAEELRAKRHAAIALLDQLPQAIFLEMFGDPATNPQKWPRIPIEALVEKVTNWNPAQLSGEFQYIDISSIDSESKQVGGVRRIAVEDAPSRARQRIQSGDVLVSTVRPNLNAVAVVRDIDDTGTASTGFCVLRPQPKRAVFSYLFCWVRSKPFIESMARQATGASYPAVNDRIVKSFEVFDVPLDLQNVFAARLESIDRIKSAKVHALTEADALFSAAQHAVFGGPE